MSSNQHTLGVYTAITSKNCTQVPKRRRHPTLTSQRQGLLYMWILFQMHNFQPTIYVSANIILNGFNSNDTWLCWYTTPVKETQSVMPHSTQQHICYHTYVCACGMRNYLCIHEDAFVRVYQRLGVAQATSLLLCYHSNPINPAVTIPSALALQVTGVCLFRPSQKFWHFAYPHPVYWRDSCLRGGVRSKIWAIRCTQIQTICLHLWYNNFWYNRKYLRK